MSDPIFHYSVVNKSFFRTFEMRDKAQLRTAAEERDLRKMNDHIWKAEVFVSAIVPELETVIAKTKDDSLQVHLWEENLRLLSWKELHEGQRLILLLKGVLAPQILRVSLENF